MPARAIHVFAVLTLLLGYSYSTRGDDSLPPPFITSLGSHRLFDGKLTLHVLEKGEFVTYKLEEAERKVKDDTFDGNIKITYLRESQIKKGAKWFVFPVSADEVWIYEGDDKLCLYTWDDPNHNFSNYSHSFINLDKDRDLIKKAPKDCLTRLPKSMKEKYGIEEPEEVLTTLGLHHFFKERLSIELIETKGMINCTIKRKLADGLKGEVETGPVNPRFEKEAKWFVYPQAEDEIWTFDGRDHLILIIFGEGHPENVSWHQLASVRGANGRKVPDKVKERLPEGFLDKPEEK